MNKTIVIPAAGTGSRLGEYTQNYNKAMCTLGPKPVISYIIQKFSDEDEIIILLGYKGDLLRQVIDKCYPYKNIKYVNVDKYEGEGSGLGYSLLCAKDLLQKPFIFWSNDTVIEDDISDFDYNTNWMMLSTYKGENSFQYRHAKTDDKLTKIYSILPKGDYESPDASKRTKFPYIGISFIKDYEAFWKASTIDRNVFINGGESIGLNNIRTGIKPYFTDSWIDTGNKIIFEKYKKIYNQKMDQTILEKPNEAIWFIGDRVVKFHLSEKFIADRVKRVAMILNDKMEKAGFIIPDIIDYDKNIYVMNKCKGITLSKVIDPILFYELVSKYFDAVEEISVYNKNCSNDQLNNLKGDIYKDFYYDKTIKRINEYCNKFEDTDKEIIINGLKCSPAKDIINSFDWNKLGRQYCKLSENYHGDFHLENIMYDKDERKFILLDWRQNFGKQMIGDLYYDVAKMWHSLIVNHNMVKDDLFTVKYVDENSVQIDIHRTFIDTECEEQLKKYLKKSNFDYDFSSMMTAVIFLNIAACHIYPYSKFLFYLGKYLINLWYKENCYNDKFFKENVKDE